MKVSEVKMTKEQKDFLINNEVNFEHDVLTAMFLLQKRFDSFVNEKRNIQFSDLDFAYKNQFALISELGELVDEVGWPWWKSKTTNAEGFLKECCDLQHFILKQAIHIGFDAHEFTKQIHLLRSDSEVIPAASKSFSTLESQLFNFIQSIARMTLNPLSKQMIEDAQVELLNLQEGLTYEDIFLYYVDKNLENYNRQLNKSKDQTRTNYTSGNNPQFKKLSDGSIQIVKEDGTELITLTKETIFQLQRM